MIDILRDIEMPDNVFDMQDLVINIQAENAIILLKMKRMHDMRAAGKPIDRDNLHRTHLAYDIKGRQIKKIKLEITKLKKVNHSALIKIGTKNVSAKPLSYSCKCFFKPFSMLLSNYKTLPRKCKVYLLQ